MLSRLKNYLIAGLLFWLPLFVTFILIRFLLEILDNSVAMLPAEYQPSHWLGAHIPGIGLIFTVIILLVTGILVTNIIGNKLVDIWEKLLNRIPFIRSIYSAVKQVAQTLFKPTDTSFRKVVLVEYPRKGMHSIAFVTSEKFTHATFEEPMYTIFIPTTPNPTSGYILFIPKEDAIELPYSVEDALKMVISLGVVSPNSVSSTITPGKSASY